MVYRGIGPAGRRKSSPIGCLIASLIFACPVVIGSFFLFPTWHARLSGIQTQGTVVSISDCPSSSDSSGGDAVARPFQPTVNLSSDVEPTIRFTDQRGQQHEASISTCGTYGVGEILTLWYLPDDPQTIATQDELSSTFLIGGVLAAVFALPLLISLLLLFFRIFPALFFWLARRRAPPPQSALVASAYPAPLAFSSSAPTLVASAPPVASLSTPGIARVGQPVEISGLGTALLKRVLISTGNARSRPQPGSFYLIAQVALRNRSGQPLDAFTAGRFLLWDVPGNEYQSALLPGTVYYITGTIQSGEERSEQLAYSVPASLRQFILTFQQGRFSPPLATWEIMV